MKKSSYGKRPLWFWLALYGAIGAVGYLAVYLVFFSAGGAGSGY